MRKKWDYEIEHHIHDRGSWIVWKQHSLENFQKGDILPYYGIFDGDIICEATAMLNSEGVQNNEGLVGKQQRRHIRTEQSLMWIIMERH